MGQLGIDAHEFRTQVGLSLEALGSGSALATISAETVARICELLDIELADLLGRQRPPPISYPDDDDLILEAALARHGQLAVRDLAMALKWPLLRVERALQALALRLLGTALHLVRTRDRVHLEPRQALLDDEAQARLHAAAQGQIPLSVQEAVVVLQLLHHRYGTAQEPRGLDAETIDVLLHRRLAEQDETGLQPHPDISYAMGLRPFPEQAKPPRQARSRSRS